MSEEDSRIRQQTTDLDNKLSALEGLQERVRSLEEENHRHEASTLLGLSKAGVVNIIHSLFTVRKGDYDMAPKLWGVLGEVPEDGLPSIFAILPVDLSTIDSFYGTSMEEFDSHVTGLISTLQRDLESNAHKALAKEDDGATLVSARGLVILPSSVALIFLDLPPPVTIAEAAARLVPHLFRSLNLHTLDPLRWLQASFTTRSGGDFIVEPIHIQRTLGPASPTAGSSHHAQLLSYLNVSFPG